ncbi:MAG: hypothetical protein LQ350_001232 [Teloschistes chrysophthalmus]|nr:MAG: hypothetical protein LQ350_001232 [Niorma chrysophthalma]
MLGRFWAPAPTLHRFSPVFLLSFAITCNWVQAYLIDDTCKNYKGSDITADMQKAVNEVQEMAGDAFAITLTEDESTNHLLDALFSTDRSKHDIVREYFATFHNFSPSQDFVVICDDAHVQLQPDYMLDPIHGWLQNFDAFTPCDYTRKPGAQPSGMNAYTMNQRLIYLCPQTLDKPKGRSLAPYKDQELFGQSIDDYMLAPATLFHELLHTHITALNDEQVQAYPDYNDPNVNPFDQTYLASLPMITAYGFSLCWKIGSENPSRAVTNCDNVAYCALGVYLHKNDWGNTADFSVGIGHALP